MSTNEVLNRKVMKNKLHVLGNTYFSEALKNINGKVVLVSFNTGEPDKLTVQLTDGTYVCEAFRIEMMNLSPCRPFYG
ncbi:Mu transposase%2C C-terminal [Serratia marcescens]|uniref:Mu transposase C-terminal domain-containing protein n=1 Tax=Serratia marcescens TaxID=615 RepID=UPI0007455645|nr:Mu transposase C-terminal domain-containing protein [Serratia marcescens]CUZ67754.1 Mu transposase%2C C-terminal [Serratia marcescens]CVF21642.1 Mu transposase%2C C-terminal [Serratia marcescens]CVG49003.1 Mu transposase%2C C-terminal [Serratia marcescens]